MEKLTKKKKKKLKNGPWQTWRPLITSWCLSRGERGLQVEPVQEVNPGLDLGMGLFLPHAGLGMPRAATLVTPEPWEES